jgi:hypothetical protein
VLPRPGSRRDLFEQLPRSSGVSGHERRVAGGDETTRASVAVGRRRHLRRPLAKICARGLRSPRLCEIRRFVERGRGGRVRAPLREREMARALLWGGDDAGERRVRLTSVQIRSARVCGRRQQGVLEPDRVVVCHEDPCPDHLGDRLTRVAPSRRSGEQGRRRLRGRGREQRDETGSRRKRGEARVERLRETRRYPQLALSGNGIRGQHAPDLQGEQRVAAAQLVHLHDARTGKRQLEPLVEEAVDGADAERPHRN